MTPAERRLSGNPLCRLDGHRLMTINWIGMGRTQICERPGCDYKAGLKSVDAKGGRVYHG